MKTQKIIACFMFAIYLAAFNDSTAFAEIKKEWSEQFSNCMQMAKNNENKKDWSRALLCYYFALETWKNWDEAMVAYAAYSELAKSIESGKPGRGNFDKFSLYENWKNLLISTEKLGNEIFPYDLYYGSFETVKLDLQNRRADYSVKLSFKFSNSYLKTVDVVARGYANARDSSWTELPETFPDKPVTNDSLWISVSDWPETKRIPFSYSYDFGNLTRSKFTDCKALVPYEAVFQIVNEEGTVLSEAAPYIIGDKTERQDFYYVGPNLIFKNVPEDAMKIIDSGKVFIKLKSIKLIHGNVTANYSIRGRRYFTGGKKTDVIVLHTLMHQGNVRSLAELVFLDRSIQKSFYTGLNIGRKKIYCAYFNTAEVFRLGFGDEYISMNKFLNWHGAFSQYEYAILCNILSQIAGRSSVYTINGSNAIGDFMLINDLVGRSNIKTNAAANGFRMPSLEEVKKFLAHSNNTSLPALKDNGSLFTGEAYNYCTADKQFSDGAYLLLYYLE